MVTEDFGAGARGSFKVSSVQKLDA